MNMLNYIPSPVEFDYDYVYSAIANISGRMQYYKSRKGRARTRISRTEFSQIYNHSKIIAVKPIQEKKMNDHIQMDIYVKEFRD